MAKITGSGKLISNLGIILLFVVISLAYFYPQLEGKVLQQHDITHYKGMSKELADYRNETGEEAWISQHLYDRLISMNLKRGEIYSWDEALEEYNN